MPPITTDDLATWDECPRKAIYTNWETPRISLATALNESLHIGLRTGKAIEARNHLMARAAEPGLAITAMDIYAAAVHHSALIEVVVAYLLAGEGAWKPTPTVKINGHEYQPLSYLRGNQLRRVVLCSRWDALREKEETSSWRTLGDVAATGLPMLINAIVIGSANKQGFRPSVWTIGYAHKTSKDYRVQRRTENRDGTGHAFNAEWKEFKRELSGRKAEEWLKIMQSDEAFGDVVHSTTVDLPYAGIRDEMAQMLDGVARRESISAKERLLQTLPLALTPGSAITRRR
jgi:hypothetical protein